MRKKRIQILADAVIFACQLLLIPVFAKCKGNVLMLCVLLLFLLTAAAFAYKTNVFSHKIEHLPAYMSVMFPHCIRLAIIAGMDALLYYFIRRFVDFAVTWLVFSLLMLLLSGIVIFAAGAARTMLFLDAHKNR